VLPLGEVLRRSHRTELLALAAALRVRETGRGRDLLAAEIESALRALGSLHPFGVMVLGRQPPPWPDVVAGLAERMGLTPTDAVVDQERAILARWRTDGATDTQRQAIARVLALPAQPPTPSDAALQLGPRARLPALRPGLLLGVLVRIIPVFAPFFMALVLLRVARTTRDGVLRGAILELQRLRLLVQRRLVVALVGPPSSGKDAAILALFGLDTGNVDPVAGSTKAVALFTAPGDPHIQIVNTPGLGDVLTELTLETREILDQADLFLFLVNSQGGVRQRERDEFARVRQRQKPTLVLVNKVDTLKDEDRPRFLADVAAKLRVEPAQVLGVAVDPLPQLSPVPIGIDAVHAWLSARLDDLGRDPDALRQLG
jgi:GTP-binding protein EngB required for normal cell division